MHWKRQSSASQARELVNPDNFSLEDFAAAESFIKDKEKNQEDLVDELSAGQVHQERGKAVVHDLSFADMLSLPGCLRDTTGSKNCRKNNNRKQHAQILTSKPNKSVLEEKQNKKTHKLKLKVDQGDLFGEDNIEEEIRMSNRPKRKCIQNNS
ncbi:hypothetical protein FQR65_LT07281 [Abscondita terminalis]|nr:hypothetical protein FQR65_LT07281 [Abscondita terminalis]